MAYLTAEQFKAISDPNIRACALVGYFLQTFSLVEFRLDQLITRGLGLISLQGTILAKNIDLRRKINIAKVLADIQCVDQELQDKAFKKLHGLSDIRNTAAHEYFHADADGVKFLRAVAKEKLSYPATVWTTEKVEQMVNKLVEVSKALDEIAAQLDPVSLSEILKEPRNALLDLMINPPEPPEEKP